MRISLLMYSLRPKINAILEFKICPTKNINFDPPTTKDKAVSGRFSQKTTNTSFTYHKKTKGILVILHLPLVCVFGPKIAFILDGGSTELKKRLKTYWIFKM